MKKIDRLLLTSFIGPFIVAFGIALFVLIMQFLWLYIDEIAGKGVSIFVMIELIAYLSIATFPMALPIAVLIASVMVLGNLSERYELSSMKSAGISLLRVMRGLAFCALGVALFSYICSDFLIPIANLKFKSRLYDIRKQKPALTLEKGVFNDDFRQFVIRIGNKERDGETIEDVMIEDQSNLGQNKFQKTLADSGQMYTSKDKRFFVMNLFKGTQYAEPSTQGKQNQKYPFVRTNFSSWTKVWDMKEFDMTASDEDRFKTQRSMLSMSQLRDNIDSLNRVIEAGRQAIANDLLLNLKRKTGRESIKPADVPMSFDTAAMHRMAPAPTGKPADVSASAPLSDTAAFKQAALAKRRQGIRHTIHIKDDFNEPDVDDNAIKSKVEALRKKGKKPKAVPQEYQGVGEDRTLIGPKKQAVSPSPAPKNITGAKKQVASPTPAPAAKNITAAKKQAAPQTSVQATPVVKQKTFQQELTKPLNQYAAFEETFPADDRTALMREARPKASLYRSIFVSKQTDIENRRKESVKTGYELFSKYSFALVCLIFLYIGAPMGAIIRKGGFGYPVLVSIVVFVAFIMLTILCRKLAELYILSPFWAAMTPCIILMPIAAYLTRKAMNDSQMINTDRLERWWAFIARYFRKIRRVPAAT